MRYYYLTTPRIAIIQQMDNKKYWQRCGENAALTHPGGNAERCICSIKWSAGFKEPNIRVTIWPQDATHGTYNTKNIAHASKGVRDSLFWSQIWATVAYEHRFRLSRIPCFNMWKPFHEIFTVREQRKSQIKALCKHTDGDIKYAVSAEQRNLSRCPRCYSRAFFAFWLMELGFS